MNVLSIQSDVVYGHVGNAAARFALQRLGHEVWAVPTVLLSSHAGYAKVGGESLSADLLRRLVDGLDANGWLGRCDAVLSGYLGHADHAGVVADAVRRVKAANRRRALLPRSGFRRCGPRLCEARRGGSHGARTSAARRHRHAERVRAVEPDERCDPQRRRRAGGGEALGRPVVVVTSVPVPDGRIGTLAVAKDEAWLASTPLLENPPHGSGDLLAALFLAHRLAGRSMRDTLAATAASVFDILERSVTAGSHEMLLIEHQDALVAPPESPALRIEQIG